MCYCCRHREEYPRHGFIGSKVGQTRLPKRHEDMGLLEGLKRVNSKNPLKNTADLIILLLRIWIFL
jgi:hypothetical protein